MAEQLGLDGLTINEPSRPKVVHCRKAKAGTFIYIGRPSIYGNPFGLKNPRDSVEREHVIERYQKWFDDKIKRDATFRVVVEKLRGHDLGCWCAPRICHGDVLLRWANRTNN